MRSDDAHNRGQVRARQAGRTLLVFVLSALVVASGACSGDCRSVKSRPLSALACESSATAGGELTFDAAATFSTFLDANCMPSSSPADRAALVSSVDFSTEGVFVAVGDRARSGSCITSREVADTNLCSSGLVVDFRDKEVASAGCSASPWTVAVVMSRQDLRDVMQAGLAAQPAVTSLAD